MQDIVLFLPILAKLLWSKMSENFYKIGYFSKSLQHFFSIPGRFIPQILLLQVFLMTSAQIWDHTKPGIYSGMRKSCQSPFKNFNSSKNFKFFYSHLHTTFTCHLHKVTFNICILKDNR